MQAFSVHLSILYTAKVYIFRFDCEPNPIIVVRNPTRIQRSCQPFFHTNESFTRALVSSCLRALVPSFTPVFVFFRKKRPAHRAHFNSFTTLGACFSNFQL